MRMEGDSIVEEACGECARLKMNEEMDRLMAVNVLG